MKIKVLLLIVVGVFFIISGVLLLNNNSSYDFYFNGYIENIIKKDDVIYNIYSNKIESLNNSLNREEYEKVINEINALESFEVKKLLVDKTKGLDELIKEEEERLLKYTSIENLNGKVSAFTPYCSDGCNGYTASGRYVGNSIYYDDKDYGRVMIVAADKSYPFGTIVRFNNLKYFGNEVFAIVLDRGGAVGKGRKVLFDLLLSSEKAANNFGIAKNVSCDILRLGY